MEHIRHGQVLCDLRELLHALGIEYGVICITRAEAMHPTNDVAKAKMLIILGRLGILEANSLRGVLWLLGCGVLPAVAVIGAVRCRVAGVIGVAIRLVVGMPKGTVLSIAPRVLWGLSKPLLH